jgi:DNA-binding NarL/FixJ family response regulator
VASRHLGGSAGHPDGVGSRTHGRAALDDNCGVPTSVLIVDDHASFRAGARRMLEASGYLVIGEAVDGEAALEAVRSLRPDVVLLDVQLPDIDGFEIAHRLHDAGADSAIVLTSSHDRADFGDALDESPARGFIAKGELSGVTLAELAG